MSDNDTATYQDFLKNFQPGNSFGPRYKIVKTLGAGGMGRVFLARDLELNIDVALKVIRPELLQNEKALERFKNELIVARRVSHKNVVRIHDIGEVNGLKYLSMTYIAGKSLKEALKQSGGFEIDRAIQVFTQICEGVSSAHEEGVLHRDLKPANVMLDENDRVYITDFGVAKWLDSPDETGTGLLLGTPAYLSPEQTWGERPDARSDIYALGLVLYEILYGSLPFDQEKAVAFKSRLPADFDTKIRKALPAVPRYLIAILKKCLDPNRTERYQSVAAILNDLRNQKVKARSFSWKYPAAAIVCLLLIALGYLWKREHPQTPVAQQAKADIGTIHSAIVLPFRNRTGKQEMSWVETTMADLLVSDLSQTRNLRIVNQDRMFQTLKDLKISPGSYDDETARKLGEILDVDYVVGASLSQAGSILRADVQLTDVKQQKKSSFFKAVGNKQEDIIPMVDGLARDIQREMLQVGRPVKSNTASSSHSIQALKSFNEGARLFREGEYDAAITALQDCIARDPGFARAYLKLSQVYEQNGQEDESIDILNKGMQLTGQADEKTRSTIRAQYLFLQGDSKKAIQSYQDLCKKFPNDPELLFSLSSLYEQNGDLTNASGTLQKLIHIDPNDPQAYFQLGKDTILMGESEKAISQYLVKALAIQTQLNNRYGQADVLNAFGVAYERLGRYNDAIKYYQDSLTIKEQIGNKKGATTSLSNIAKIYIFQSQFEKAKVMLNRALKAYEELQDSAGTADVWNSFGVIYENQGQYDEALKHYRNALQIRKNVGDDRLTALSYENIGQIHYLMGHYDEAQAFAEQALSLRKKINDQNGVILSLQSLGFLQIAQGELDKGIKYFLDALNQARSIHFENAIAVSLGNLGTIYSSQGRYKAAIDSYSEAIDVLKSLKDRKGEAEYTKLTGAAFLDMGSYVPARKKLNSAMQLASAIQSEELVVDTQILLGRLDREQANITNAQAEIDNAIKTAMQTNYQKGLIAANIEKGLLTKSVSLLKAALQETKEVGDVWLTLSSKYALASFYLESGQSQQAIRICTEAIPVAREMGLAPYLLRFHSIAGRAHARLKDEGQMREHYNQAARYAESIRNEISNEYLGDFLKLCSGAGVSTTKSN
jgi:serine/threonine protein kinase